jgi:hypothetical protein
MPWGAKKKTDITSIKSNLNKVVNLQQAVTVTDSTFLLCRARDETRKAKANCLAFVGAETESMYEVPTP